MSPLESLEMHRLNKVNRSFPGNLKGVKIYITASKLPHRHPQMATSRGPSVAADSLALSKVGDLSCSLNIGPPVGQIFVPSSPRHDLWDCHICRSVGVV